MPSSRGATHWSGEIWHMMMPVLRQGWVVKQNMMWWQYFVAMLYRNIIKPSKHLQGGILTVTYCTFLNFRSDRIENKSFYDCDCDEMTKKQQWVLYGKCWSMYPIIHLSVSRKMSTWEEWRVGPYHQPRSTAHPPPHQSAVLCGHWLHQWVEQDMVTTCSSWRVCGANLEHSWMAEVSLGLGKWFKRCLKFIEFIEEGKIWWPAWCKFK